jgi:hypothetical protein
MQRLHFFFSSPAFERLLTQERTLLDQLSHL